MSTQRWGDLEVLVATPDTETNRPPLLFVHGAYTAAWCWSEHFLPWFAARGWPAYAVSLSGHGASRKREHLDLYAIEDYVADVAEVAAKLPAPPVLIGHSMGGMVLQKYLEQANAPAVALLCSVPPQGLWSSALGLMLNHPNLLRDLNRILEGGQPEPDSLRDALFHQPIEHDRLLEYYALCQPESHRAIWDMTLFNLPFPALMHRPPMLVLGAEFDRLIPPMLVEMTAHTYGMRAEIMPGIGHGVMLEQDWERVAMRIEDWLEKLQLA